MRSPKNLAIMIALGFLAGLVVMWGAMSLAGKPSDFEHSDLEVEVTTMLDAQTLAWNKGDIEGFMQDYWKSPDLRFTSNDSIATGWQETLDRYQRRYPDRAAIGRLEFTDQRVEVLSPTDALVFGRFTLFREADQPTGLYTLHVKKFGDEWKIVSDHTSTE